jgi:4a-hydroxytetrahydrobiopterin dehydratase
MFWKQRSVRGSADYWRRRRRKVIENLKAHGFIAQVGPAGQVVHQRFVGQKEAQRWWRQAERPPRLWLLTLLLSSGLAVVIQPAAAAGGAQALFRCPRSSATAACQRRHPARSATLNSLPPLSMAAQPLTPEQIESLRVDLPQWSLRNGRLHRDLVFADFSEAFGFLSRVALAAEAMGHHPEWSNVWNRVSIELITHDIGSLSDLDLALARRIETLAGASCAAGGAS